MLCFILLWGHERIQKVKKVKKGHFFLIWKWLKKWSIYFFKGKKTIPIPFFHKKNAWKYFFLIFEKNKISLWNNLLKKKDTPKIMDLKFPQPISITGIWVLQFWLIMEWIEAKLWPCLFLTNSIFFFMVKKLLNLLKKKTRPQFCYNPLHIQSKWEHSHAGYADWLWKF